MEQIIHLGLGVLALIIGMVSFWFTVTNRIIIIRVFFPTTSYFSRKGMLKSKVIWFWMWFSVILGFALFALVVYLMNMYFDAQIKAFWIGVVFGFLGSIKMTGISKVSLRDYETLYGKYVDREELEKMIDRTAVVQTGINLNN